MIVKMSLLISLCFFQHQTNLSEDKKQNIQVLYCTYTCTLITCTCTCTIHVYVLYMYINYMYMYCTYYNYINYMYCTCISITCTCTARTCTCTMYIYICTCIVHVLYMYINYMHMYCTYYNYTVWEMFDDLYLSLSQTLLYGVISKLKYDESYNFTNQVL